MLIFKKISFVFIKNYTYINVLKMFFPNNINYFWRTTE